MARRGRDLLDVEFLSRLERLELNVRRLAAGELRGEVATRRRGVGTLFREHRPYVAGDDPRFLDWNTYLRLDDLQVKEFEADETPRMLILVDRSASMGLRGEAKLEQALKLAAAIGSVGLIRHALVTCTLFPGEQGPTMRGRGSILRLLEHLAATEARGEARFLPAFQAATAPGRGRGVAVVLSDFFDTAQHAAALRFLRHQGYVTHALHLVDPKDRDIQPGELLELVDVETGRTLRERVDRKIANAYSDAVGQHFRTVEQTCRSMRVLYARVAVDEPVERAVVDLIRRGAMIV